MTTPIIRPKPSPEQEPKLPDQIADAWAAVLIDKPRANELGRARPVLATGRSCLSVEAAEYWAYSGLQEDEVGVDDRRERDFVVSNLCFVAPCLDITFFR